MTHVSVASIPESEGWGEWTMPNELAAYTTACNEVEAAQDRLSGMIAVLHQYTQGLARDQRSALSVPDGLPSPQAIKSAYLALEAAKGAKLLAWNALTAEQRSGQRTPGDDGRLNID